MPLKDFKNHIKSALSVLEQAEQKVQLDLYAIIQTLKLSDDADEMDITGIITPEHVK